MLRVLTLLFLSFISLSCNTTKHAKTNATEPVNEASTKGITFKQVQLKLQVIKKNKDVFSVTNEVISLDINVEQGIYSGKSTCNSYFGKVELIGENSLHFYMGGMTEMMCDEHAMTWEKHFMNALTSHEFTVNEFKNNVQFTNTESALVLTFVKTAKQEE